MTKIDKNFTVNRIISSLTKINFTTNKMANNANPELIEIPTKAVSEQKILANILDNDNLSNSEKADLFFTQFINTKNPIFISKAGNFSVDYQFIAWVVNKAINEEFDTENKIKTKIEKKWNTKIVEEFFNNLEWNEQDFYIFGEFITESKKEEFYKQKHNQYKNKQDIDETKNTFDGWLTKKCNIKKEQATELCKYDGAKLYGFLPNEYAYGVWNNALSKGFAPTAKGTNGVKFLDEKLLELKIKGDQRLYTKSVYKNTKGDYLAIFENEANHSSIKNIVSTIKELQIIEDHIFADIADVYDSESSSVMGDHYSTEIESY